MFLSGSGLPMRSLYCSVSIGYFRITILYNSTCVVEANTVLIEEHPSRMGSLIPNDVLYSLAQKSTSCSLQTF